MTTRRLLPIGLVLTAVAMTPAWAQVPSCGPLLHSAIDTPIPPDLVMGRTVFSHPGSEASLALLSRHLASVAIEGMPGAYVGLGDSVERCRADGCDAFVYVTSNGVAAVSGMLRVDGTTAMNVWTYGDQVPDQALMPFYEQLIPAGQVIFASLYSVPAMIVAWAGVEALVADIDGWMRGTPYQLGIPLYLIAQRSSGPLDFRCANPGPG